MSDHEPATARDPRIRGRRTAWRGRLDATVVVALALPLAAVGGSLLVTSPPSGEPARAPQEVSLARIDRGCPTDLPRVPAVRKPDPRPGSTPGALVFAAASDGTARLRVLAADRTEPVDIPLTSGAAVTWAEESRAAVLSAEAELARGLLAARLRRTPLAATACTVPTSEVFFTGVGARSDHASVVEIDNPDVGAAVVDLTLYSRQGDVDAPDLRGIRVDGRTSVRLDLARVVPRRGDLALRATVSRGRATVSVVDSVSRPGEPARSDWLGAQPTASSSNVVLGLPQGPGRRTLLLGNPGADEAVATVRIVTDGSVFTPTDLPETRVRPGGLVAVPLSQLLRSRAARGALGVVVESQTPLTATLRSEVDGDLALAPALEPVDDWGAALVPAGRATLMVAGATGSTQARILVRDASGRSLLDRALAVRADQGLELALPEGAALVEIRPDGPLTAAVLVEGTGSAILPLLPVPQHALVPQVEPGRP